MTRSLVLGSVAVALTATLLYAHDLFIKLDSYFVEPNSRVTIPILNGTFAKSENWIAPDRVVDVSLVTPLSHRRLGTVGWAPTADSLTTLLTVSTDVTGTYVLGVATRPRELDLSAADFNAYLEHDGIPDVLETRRRSGELDRAARERYAKHVKAVFQVGERRSNEFTTVLGYPAEIVPLSNPYQLASGDELRVRCLVHGEPVANQLVIAGGEGEGGPIPERATRTDADGVARFTIHSAGKWYVKFINMVPGDGGVDYVSEWATLTFALN